MSILDGIKILGGLNQEELNSLENFCQERFISAGDNLFLEGDEANSMYLLSKGKIKIYTEKDNEEVVLGYIESEDMLGEMALFGERSKRMASARTIEDSRLIVLLEFSIQELTKKHPEILEKIKGIIERRKKENEKLI